MIPPGVLDDPSSRTEDGGVTPAALALACSLALLIGLSLGAVGGGGSILAVPILIGVAGLAVDEATTASLVVVGTAAVVGLVAHGMAGRVHWGTGVAFGAAGVGGALVGTRINRALDPDLLLTGFAVVMLVVAARMAQGLRHPDRATPAADVPSGPLPAPVPVERPAGTPRWSDGASLRRYVSAPATAGARAAAPAAPDPLTATTSSPGGWTARRVAEVVATGTAVGLLTGTFGVGGGFVIVPALILVLGLPLAVATGTSLLVIAINSVVALGLRGGLDTVDWSVVGPFTAAAAVGVIGGRRVADRVPTRTLTAALTALITVIALWTGARGLAGLT